MQLAANMHNNLAGTTSSSIMVALDANEDSAPRGASAAMMLLRHAALQFAQHDAETAIPASGIQGALKARAAQWGGFNTVGVQRWSLAIVPAEPASALSDAAAARGIIISLALLRRRFLRRYELAGIDDLAAIRS